MKNPLLKISTSLCFTAALFLPRSQAQAQTVLFSDTFDTDTSANWTVTDGFGPASGVSDYTVFFNFNYQTNKYVRFGVTNTIPAAPGGGGNGVKMYVNKNDAVADLAAVSLYPKNQVFSNDYVLRFDMWLNYGGGTAGAGGTGTTEFGTFGINHVGDKVNWSDKTSTGSGSVTNI